MALLVIFGWLAATTVPAVIYACRRGRAADRRAAWTATAAAVLLAVLAAAVMGTGATGLLLFTGLCSGGATVLLLASTPRQRDEEWWQPPARGAGDAVRAQQDAWAHAARLAASRRKDNSPARPARPGAGPGRHMRPVARVVPRAVPPPSPAPRAAGGFPGVGAIDGPWAALIDWTADFEPEDDADLLGFYASVTAGLVAWADALLDHTDTLGEGGTGLDPAFLSAIEQFAEMITEAAAGGAEVRRRYLEVYEPVIDTVAEGTALPHETRKFITGDTGEAA